MKIPRYLASDRIDAECEYRFTLTIKTSNDVSLHCHDYFELQFFPLQNITMHINGEEKIYPKGTLLFIRPDDCHDLINPQLKQWDVFHLAFTKNIADSVFGFLTDAFEAERLLAFPMPPHIVLSETEAEDYANKMYLLNSIDPVDIKKRIVYIRFLLIHVFANYFSEKHTAFDMGIPGWLRNTCNEMAKIENFSNGIQRMVEISGKTHEHLNRTMRKFLSLTPATFVNNQRLNYIANNLLNSNEQIQDLCSRSGFADVPYMNVQFKKRYGVSPREFRNQKTYL